MSRRKPSDEDARQANCGKCWAHPGQPCWRMSGGKPTKKTRKTSHPERKDRARRRLGL